MISARSTQERRKDPRLANNIPVKICQEGGNFVAETQNISRSGAYCCVNKYIAPMTKLKIHLLFSSPEEKKRRIKKVSCEGVVVRSEPVLDGKGYHLAIFFSDILKRDAEYITDYVSVYMEKDEVV